ncbi:MAG: immunoglobulin domain-containing protein [Luteolibacter sp.]
MKNPILGLLSASLLLPTAASAALLSQEGFSGYTPGQLSATTSPTVAGYTGNWIGVDFGNVKPAVAAGSLSYGGANYAAGLGNKVTVPFNNTGGEITANNSGRVQRLFDSSLAVTDATAGTLYLSFLFQSGQETGATTYQTLGLYQGGFTDPARNFDIGLTNNNGQTGTQCNFGTDNAYTSTGVAADTNVHLLVVKFNLSATAASDSVTVWVDPVLGAGEPTGGTTVTGKDLTWDRLTFSDYDGNSCAWDEIRWGTDFNSVTVQNVLPAVPTFTSQPSGYTGNVQDTVTLTALAESNPTPTFQWEKSANGTTGWAQVSGATDATLVFSPAAFSDNGYYRLVADNGNPPAATSNVVQVSLVYPPPSIVTQPAPTAAQVGSNVTLSVAANGLGDLTYQWYKGVNPVGGVTTNNTLTLNNVQLGDSGDYSVKVTDHFAETESPPQTATVATSNTATVSVFAAWSGLVSQEPFDIAVGYVVGDLPGQTPSITGYTGAWTDIDFGDAEPAVSTGSLTYSNPSYLGSSGDKAAVATNITGGEITAANSGRVYRKLDAPLVVGDTTTGVRYLSLLYQSGQETGVTVYQMLELKNAAHTDFNRSFDIGLSNNGGMIGSEYDFSAEGTYSSTGIAADTNVHLLVVKFDLSADADSDNVTVWVDPTLGAGEPAGGTTISGKNLNWDRMALSDYDGNSAAWDEIRWGSSFDSVTVSSTPANTYASWIAGYPGVGSKTAFNDDADADGIKNGLENFFGTNPAVSNTGITQISKSGNTVTFQHPQNTTPGSDVSGAYVWSTDLATFNADGATAGGTTVSFGKSTVAGTTTVTATMTGTVPAKLFVALKATQTAP